ncbi:hypothetical protein MOTC310_19235 [Methylobacterium oryzae]|uniref:Uncharacterized protein n=1 Tax=Methylobacterium oryzae TaxID=334852 RepID=A0ABU7TRW7_9HYPH
MQCSTFNSRDLQIFRANDRSRECNLVSDPASHDLTGSFMVGWEDAYSEEVIAFLDQETAGRAVLRRQFDPGAEGDGRGFRLHRELWLTEHGKREEPEIAGCYLGISGTFAQKSIGSRQRAAHAALPSDAVDQCYAMPRTAAQAEKVDGLQIPFDVLGAT